MLVLALPAHSSSPPAPGWQCIHAHEISGHAGTTAEWHWGPSLHPGQRAWNGYYNGFQFTASTWARANRLLHRSDDPQWSPPWVQLQHASAIYFADGRSWREWPTTSRLCGLR